MNKLAYKTLSFSLSFIRYNSIQLYIESSAWASKAQVLKYKAKFFPQHKQWGVEFTLEVSQQKK